MTVVAVEMDTILNLADELLLQSFPSMCCVYVQCFMKEFTVPLLKVHQLTNQSFQTDLRFFIKKCLLLHFINLLCRNYFSAKIYKTVNGNTPLAVYSLCQPIIANTKQYSIGIHFLFSTRTTICSNVCVPSFELIKRLTVVLLFEKFEHSIIEQNRSPAGTGCFDRFEQPRKSAGYGQQGRGGLIHCTLFINHFHKGELLPVPSIQIQKYQ